MSSQLIQKLRTKDDLDILKEELRTLENALYNTRIKYDDIIHNDIRSWVSEIILSESKDTDPAAYIKSIEGELISVTILSASINFEPSNNFIDRISDWLKKNVDEKMVVDLLLNTASLGGIQLSYSGKYLDLSLRKKIIGEMEKISLK